MTPGETAVSFFFSVGVLTNKHVLDVTTFAIYWEASKPAPGSAGSMNPRGLVPGDAFARYFLVSLAN